jgi:tetratricopeptide (TPR) repeat protein
MSRLDELRARYRKAKLTKDPNELTRFFKSVEDVSLPTALAIDKSRAIQLSDGNEYTLTDAEDLLRDILEIDPTAIQAYVELGCLLDAIFDRSDEALDVFDRGIEQAEAQLRDLRYEKAKVQIEKRAYAEALRTIEPYVDDEDRFQRLRNEARDARAS